MRALLTLVGVLAMAGLSACAPHYPPQAQAAYRRCYHDVLTAYGASSGAGAAVGGVIAGPIGSVVAGSSGGDSVWSLDDQVKQCMAAQGYEPEAN